MAKRTKLVDDVNCYLEETAEMVGNAAAQDFSIAMWNRCLEYPIESPIEQLVYIAFHTLMKLNYLDPAEPRETPKHELYLSGTSLEPQKQLGQFRVDFLAFHRPYFSAPEKYIVVECDSQQWHERTEPERRYEKSRDRFLLSKGYKSLHFTGSEIKENPYKVAAEILSHLTGQPIDELLNANFIKEKYL